VLPAAAYPSGARPAVLGIQAAADSGLADKVRAHLAGGATVAMTPGLLRGVPELARLAGVEPGSALKAAAATAFTKGNARIALPVPYELDGALRVRDATVLVSSDAGPVLTEKRAGKGRVLVLNIRTFAEADYEAAKELLLAPAPLGVSSLPREAADVLREPLLSPLGIQLSAPAKVALYAWKDARCLYNFTAEPQAVRLNGREIALAAHECRWLEGR
jgi:hypothetical protein